MSIKSGLGRLSSTNSLTEKTLRNCPCEYAAWPPSCQSPTCQSPAAIRPVPDFEINRMKAQLAKAQQPSVLSPISKSIAWYAAISEISRNSRSRLHFAVENTNHRGPFNRASEVDRN